MLKSPAEDGFYGGIDVSGEMVFGTLVIVSNMKIFISSYRIEPIMIFLIVLSTLLYIIFYTVISNTFVTSPEFGTFYMLMSAPQTYFALILFTFMFVLVDTGSQYLNVYINKWYLAHKEKHIKISAKKSRASKSVIKSKLAPYQSKSITNIYYLLINQFYVCLY